jgi:unsaturated chondroitin disaccharide hydrolase
VTMDGSRRSTSLAVTLGVASALLLQGCSSAVASTPSEPTAAVTLTARSANAQTCSATPGLFSAYDRGGLFGVAETKLAAAADFNPRKYPIGALTKQSIYDRTGPKAWTSGFFPSSLWLMYQRTDDKTWLKRARAWTKALLPLASWEGSHDLGFMVGIPMELGMRLDPSAKKRATYREAFINAARSLSTRWNPNVKAFQSGTYDGQWGLIIDSAMNAPLLIEAGMILGGAEGEELKSRGEQHLLTLINTFIRDDGSTYHRMTFDPTTGALIGPVAGQGMSVDSTWSRGQAWAIFGFARAYQLTRNQAFLDAAETTAHFWMSHIDAQCVPAWDFDAAPDAPRDSSAASIAANGFILLGQFAKQQQLRTADYEPYARTMLHAISTLPVLAKDSPNPGVMLQQTANVNKLAKEGSYVWGDTFVLMAGINALYSGSNATTDYTSSVTSGLTNG